VRFHFANRFRITRRHRVAHFWQPDGVAEWRPEMRLCECRAAQVLAVFASQVADAGDATLAHFLVAEVVRHIGIHERRATFHKSNVDLLSPPGLLAGKKRRLNRDHGQRRRITIHRLAEHIRGLTVLSGHKRAHPGHPLRIALVAGPLRKTVAEAVAANGRVDQARVDLTQRS
jgi:hypothetical protein